MPDDDEAALHRVDTGGRIEVTAMLAASAARPPGEAAREAARVSLLHALDLPAVPARLSEVEVAGGHGDPPRLVTRGRVREVLGDRTAHLSLSHEGDTAAALVVLGGAGRGQPSSRAATSGPTAGSPRCSAARLEGRSSGT